MRNNESERDGGTGSETPRSDRNRDRFRSAAFTSLIAALLVGRFMARPDCVEAGGQPRAFGVWRLARPGRAKRVSQVHAGRPRGRSLQRSSE